MRKVLAFLLLAGAATPALAAGAADDRHGWQIHRDSGTQSNTDSNRGARSGGNTDRPHFDRSGDNARVNFDRSRGNTDRPHFDRGAAGGDNGHAQVVTHVETHGGGNDSPQRVVRVDTNAGDGNREPRFRNGVRGRFSSGDQSAVIEGGRRRESANTDSTDTVRNWRGPKIVEPSDVAVSPSLRQPDRRVPAVFRSRVPIVSDTPREGTQPRVRSWTDRRTPSVSWSRHWRDDHKYDWKTWRHRHHSIFHLGLYYDPFGWGYRPYQIGWRLWPSYYSSNYWLNDPWQYRLPYAPPGYRWIRYYDDALLIDTWDGQVVDVIYNFFW